MKIRDISIKYKLFLIYASAIMMVLSSGSLMLYIAEKSIIEKNIEKELKNSTNILFEMVKSSVTSSIRSYLRGIAEKNLDIFKHLNEMHENGKMSLENAKSMASDILLSQSIGKTGYIYVISSKGELLVHPNMKNIMPDVSGHDFIKQQLKMKEGYLEYNWANPGETSEKPKALYMVYFEPWDWIISVSSYKKDFTELVKVEDFRSSVLSTSFGETGYSFIINSSGKLLIHPKMEGENLFDIKNAPDRLFIKELCEKKSGKIFYPWQNPDESNERKKLVIFNYIPEMDWIVGSSSYLEEFYRPLHDLLMVIVITLIASLVTIFCLSYFINSKIISRPIEKLIMTFSMGASGDFSVRAGKGGLDEIGRLGQYFNILMERLEFTASQIKKTAEKYRSIIEGAVEGIFQSTPDGKFLEASPSMAKMLGYETSEELIAKVDNIERDLYVNPAERPEIINIVAETPTVLGYEVQFYKKDRSIIWALVNARAVYDENGVMKYLEGFATDITEQKKAREEILESKAELELRVHERTEALTKTIQILETTNREIKILREASEVLQACNSLSEAYSVIPRFTESLFPGSSGMIYIADNNSDRLESIVKWGNDLVTENEIAHEECWALRMGKTYCKNKDDINPFCWHINSEKFSVTCVPIIASGGFSGLFSMSHGPAKSADDGNPPVAHHSYQRLVRMFIEHFSLVISNLRLKDDLIRQSNHDPLTGLFNRRYMNACLSRELARLKRKNQPMAIMMIDIDHFKSINDSLGHAKGDEVLRDLAMYFSKNLRVEDTPCRYGGEEFVIIMPETGMGNAYIMAERIRTEVSSKIFVHSESSRINITVSVGLAVYPDNGQCVEKLLLEADKALYVAKQNGRNRTEKSDSVAC